MMACWLKFYLCGADRNGEENEHLLSEENIAAYATSEGTPRTVTGRKSRKRRRKRRAPGNSSSNVETLVNKGTYLQAMNASKEGFQRDKIRNILQHKDESEDPLQMNQAVAEVPPSSSESRKVKQTNQIIEMQTGGAEAPSCTSESREVKEMNRIIVSYAYNGNVAGAEVPSSPGSLGESAHLAEMESLVDSFLTYAHSAVVTSEEVPLSESMSRSGSEELLQMEKMVAMYGKTEEVPGSPRIGESEGMQQMGRFIVSYAHSATFHEENQDTLSALEEEELPSMRSEESFPTDNVLLSNSSGKKQPTFILSELAISSQYTSDPAVCLGVSQDVIPKSHMEQTRLKAPAAEERGLSIESMRSMSIGAYDDLDEIQEKKEPEPGQTSPPNLLRQNCRHFTIGTLKINDKKDFIKKMTLLFQKYDADNNTFIDRTELKKLYTMELGLQLEDDEWTSLFQKIDQNHDGRISLKEFLKASKTYVKGDNLEKLEEDFLKTQFALFAKKSEIRERQGIRWITKATGKSSWMSKEHFDIQVAKYGSKGAFAEPEFLTYYGAMKFATPTRFDNELKSMGFAKWTKKQQRNKKAMKKWLKEKSHW